MRVAEIFKFRYFLYSQLFYTLNICSAALRTLGMFGHCSHRTFVHDQEKYHKINEVGRQETGPAVKKMRMYYFHKPGVVIL